MRWYTNAPIGADAYIGPLAGSTYSRQLFQLVVTAHSASGGPFSVLTEKGERATKGSAFGIHQSLKVIIPRRSPYSL